MSHWSLVALLTPLWCVLMLFRAFSYARVGRLRFRSAFLWTVLWVGIGVVALWPSVLDRVPEIVGIKSGVNALIFFAFVLLFSAFFHVMARVDDLESRLVESVREQALHNPQRS